MASLKQIEANRLNSQKSTGPRSVEGKAAASQNSLKSGIYAKSQIIFSETAENLESLRDEYFHQYRPWTPAQRALVDILIDCEWLLRRFRAVESNLWNEAIDSCTIPKKSFELTQGYRRCYSQLEGLQKRINTAQKNWRTALQDLKRLQAEEPEPVPEPDAPAPQNQPVTPEIGFVPQIVNTPISTPVPHPSNALSSQPTPVLLPSEAES